MSWTSRIASDLGRTGPIERDIDKTITALKKRACLLKCGRKGRPKIGLFHLSNDESVMVLKERR